MPSLSLKKDRLNPLQEFGEREPINGDDGPARLSLNPLQEFGERELNVSPHPKCGFGLNPLQEFGEREPLTLEKEESKLVLIPFRNSGRENRKQPAFMDRDAS